MATFCATFPASRRDRWEKGQTGQTVERLMRSHARLRGSMNGFIKGSISGSSMVLVPFVLRPRFKRIERVKRVASHRLAAFLFPRNPRG